MSIATLIVATLQSNPLLAAGLGSSLSILASAFALGLRHGIDWDHIAAITDITSTSANVKEPQESWLTREPGVMLTDESHHALASAVPVTERATARESAVATMSPGSGALVMPVLPVLSGVEGSEAEGTRPAPAWAGFVEEHRRSLFLGTMYAIGHATMVVALGLTAILAAGFLPDAVDPIMERIVGGTLLFLAAYLFYSLYRFFRGGGDFRLRSRWMLVFSAAGRGYHALLTRLGVEHEHYHHGAPTDQYGTRTAYGIGLIHGIGAETGTQVLVIATAVGAGSKAMGVGALLTFTAGLIVSNSIVTLATTAGFISSQRRQGIYIAAGLLAAVFSLVVGFVFLFRAGGVLPNLDPLVRWIGGPNI